MRQMWWGPKDIGDLAGWWTQRILTAQSQQKKLRHYMEVRYEQLVTEPRATLQRICTFLELPFDECMLKYHETSAKQIGALKEYRSPEGHVISSTDRQNIHAMTQRPPDTSRIGVWRTGMSKEEKKVFHDLAGGLLQQMGYQLT